MDEYDKALNESGASNMHAKQAARKKMLPAAKEAVIAEIEAAMRDNTDMTVLERQMFDTAIRAVKTAR